MVPVKKIPFLGKDLKTEKKMPVLLVFLFAYIEQTPHLLLLKRGEKVMHMQNEWSVIAGVLNHPDLERQALIEIAGETTRLPHEVSVPKLFGIYEDKDPEREKIWVRHLVTATLNKVTSSPDELGVHIDWEHSEAAWVPLPEIIEWLSGGFLQDPVTHAILTEEKHTSDFRLHLERIRPVLDKMVSV